MSNEGIKKVEKSELKMAIIIKEESKRKWPVGGKKEERRLKIERRSN